MDIKNKEQFFKRIIEEYRLTGFMDSKVGHSMVDCLKDIYDASHGDSGFMLKFVDTMNRVLNRLPLTMLQEEELLTDETGFVYHPRYEGIQKLDDGSYVDNKAICFVEPDGSRWYGTNNGYCSTVKISFPYYPQEKLFYIDSKE